MLCLDCGGRTKVLDTKIHESHVWRKRQCPDCGHTTATHERVKDVWDMMGEALDHANSLAEEREAEIRRVYQQSADNLDREIRRRVQLQERVRAFAYRLSDFAGGLDQT